VKGGDLDPAVRERALGIFRRLIEAEAEVHGLPVERTHLHEAGGTDAIIDVVGACYGLHSLGIERLVVSRLTTGFGAVRCEHGNYPVPGPATLNLLEGFPAEAGAIEAERLTPTGAAILTTLANAWGPLPPMRVERSGYGAGDHDLGDTPNVIRGVLGSEEADLAGAREAGTPGIVVLETDVDDATPQVLAHTLERLLSAGALDASVTALTMKKGRPGHRVTVQARRGDIDRLGRILLTETPTLGLRFRSEQRIELERSRRTVSTPYGKIRVKLGTLGATTLNAWPEYDDCAAAAKRHDVTLAEVQQTALTAWKTTRRKTNKE
jgi:hypothetical protein